MTEEQLRAELAALYQDRTRDEEWFRRYWQVIMSLRSLEKEPEAGMLDMIKELGSELVYLPVECGRWLKDEVICGLFHLIFGERKK